MTKPIYSGYLIAFAMMLTALGGCTDQETSESGPAEGTNLISGRIIDATTGIPLANASVSTDPTTGEVLSNGQGRYVLKNELLELGKLYRVNISKPGYMTETVTITLKEGSSNIADAQLKRHVVGLVATPAQLRFNATDNQLSFTLSSTTSNNSYQIESDRSWLRVSPRDGQISDTDQRLISVVVDRSGLSDGVHEAKLVINSNVNSIVVDVVVAVRQTLPPTSESSTDDGTGTQGDTPPPSQASAPDNRTITKDGIILEPYGCSINAVRTVRCEVRVINPGPVKSLAVNGYHARANIGDNTYAPSGISLGAKKSYTDIYESIPSGLPVTLTFTFRDVDIDENESVVSHLAFYVSDSRYRQDSILFTGLPLVHTDSYD